MGSILESLFVFSAMLYFWKVQLRTFQLKTIRHIFTLSNTLELQRSHCWQTKSSPPFLYVKKRALNYPIDQIMSNVAQNIVNFNLLDISVSIFPGHLTLPKLITNVRLVVVVGVDACVAFLVVCKAGLSSGDDPSEQLPRHQSVPLRTTILELGPRDSAPRLEPRVEC